MTDDILVICDMIKTMIKNMLDDSLDQTIIQYDSINTIG